ncbi:reverse transcriptase domain, reverse transcriptase zinc-binding domain protein, partial [Tanacetum coccineum]
ERESWLEARKQWEEKEKEYGNMHRQKSKIRWDIEGDENLSSFMLMFILDGVLVANETMEYLKKKKERGLNFKVDFKKAYDRCKWVDTCLRSPSMSILVNGSLTEEFRLERGIRQGDPLSPFLFILAAEGLNAIVTEAVEKGIFRGVVVGENKVTVSHLQYADDTIFFGEWNKENAKSLLFNEGYMAEMARWMGEFPFTYLGLPIGENMRRVNAWGLVVEKFKNRLAD